MFNGCINSIECCNISGKTQLGGGYYNIHRVSFGFVPKLVKQEYKILCIARGHQKMGMSVVCFSVASLALLTQM